MESTSNVGNAVAGAHCSRNRGPMRTQLTTASTNDAVCFVEPREWHDDFRIAYRVDRQSEQNIPQIACVTTVFRVSS